MPDGIILSQQLPGGGGSDRGLADAAGPNAWRDVRGWAWNPALPSIPLASLSLTVRPIGSTIQ